MSTIVVYSVSFPYIVYSFSHPLISSIVLMCSIAVCTIHFSGGERCFGSAWQRTLFPKSSHVVLLQRFNEFGPWISEDTHVDVGYCSST